MKNIKFDLKVLCLIKIIILFFQKYITQNHVNYIFYFPFFIYIFYIIKQLLIIII